MKLISGCFTKKNNRVPYLLSGLLQFCPILLVLAVSLFPCNSFCHEIDKSLFITRIGTFLIDRQKDPYEKKYPRVGYAFIGTVVYADGQPFNIKSKENDYEPVQYLPIITEGGTRAAILRDCLFKPKDNHLVVPQHFEEKLSFRTDRGNIDFSRSDGLFAEITATYTDRYSVIFPFKPSTTFTQDCGPCPEDKFNQKKGYILADEIDQEQAKVLMPIYYHKSDVPMFKTLASTVSELVNSMVTCMDGTVFPTASQKVTDRIKENAMRFYNFMTGCGLKAEADTAFRGEFFGFGGGVTFSYNLKPANRKFSFELYTVSNENGTNEDRFLLIRRLKCEEDKPVQLIRLTIFDLHNQNSFDLLECELTKRTDLKHLPRGDDHSRNCMINIRENSGHDDVSKLYRFISESNDFKKLVAIRGAVFDDHRHRKMRAYLDFIINQVADFRR